MIGVLVRWHFAHADRVARELVHIQHGHTPLAEPPASRVQTMHFLVTTTVTEPPPDCEADTLRILRKEMRFCLGNNATVEPYHPPWDQPGVDPMGDMRRATEAINRSARQLGAHWTIPPSRFGGDDNG